MVTAIILLVVAGSGIWDHTWRREEAGSKRAAVIDGLVDHPNEEYISNLSSTLEGAGFRVDVYQAEDVTVELFRKLPEGDYRLIILRVHSGPLMVTDSNGTKPGDDLVIFTTERYNPMRHRGEQLRGWLAKGVLMDEGTFFAIPPRFVLEAMRGSFEDTTIILEGCYGFLGRSMLEALRVRGASWIIGWDGEISVDYADEAVLRIITEVYRNGATFREATESCGKEMGPDPYYGGRLLFYP